MRLYTHELISGGTLTDMRRVEIRMPDPLPLRSVARRHSSNKLTVVGGIVSTALVISAMSIAAVELASSSTYAPPAPTTTSESSSQTRAATPGAVPTRPPLAPETTTRPRAIHQVAVPTQSDRTSQEDTVSTPAPRFGPPPLPPPADDAAPPKKHVIEEEPVPAEHGGMPADQVPTIMTDPSKEEHGTDPLLESPPEDPPSSADTQH